jgi:hypothetical protein
MRASRAALRCLAAPLGLVAVGLSLACGDREAARGPVEIEFAAVGDGPALRLEVPKGFLLHRDASSALLRAAYPGMVPYSRDLRGRFYDDRGLWSQDLVFIRLGRQPSLPGDEDLAFPNRNDLGRFVFVNSIQRRLRPAASSDPLPASDRVTRYVGPHEHDTRYVLEQEGRLGVVWCPFETRCKGKTTWEGVLYVDYHFGRTHFPEVLDLDRSIFALVSSFSPEPVGPEE